MGLFAVKYVQLLYDQSMQLHSWSKFHLTLHVHGHSFFFMVIPGGHPFIDRRRFKLPEFFYSSAFLADLQAHANCESEIHKLEILVKQFSVYIKFLSILLYRYHFPLFRKFCFDNVCNHSNVHAACPFTQDDSFKSNPAILMRTNSGGHFGSFVCITKFGIIYHYHYPYYENSS